MEFMKIDDEIRWATKYLLDNGEYIVLSAGLRKTDDGRYYNFGYSVHYTDPITAEFTSISPEKTRTLMTHDERVGVSHAVANNIKSLVEEFDGNDSDVIIRGPLNENKATSLRYIAIADEFVKAGYKYWYIKRDKKNRDISYWLHSQIQLTMPLDDDDGYTWKEAFIDDQFKIQILTEETEYVK
jgi:hypothetical protein